MLLKVFFFKFFMILLQHICLSAVLGCGSWSVLIQILTCCQVLSGTKYRASGEITELKSQEAGWV